MNALTQQTRRNAVQALILSLGLHLLVAVSLDVSPGSISLGMMPSLRVRLHGVLQPADPALRTEVRAAERSADPDARDERRAVPSTAGETQDASSRRPLGELRGIAGERARDGSSLPNLELYFRRSQLDLPAEPLSRSPLIYPEGPYLWRLAGRVVARVYINERGTVDAVRIVEAKPPGQFEDAATEALRQVRYRPAEIAGNAVKSQKLVEVNFDPYENTRR